MKSLLDWVYFQSFGMHKHTPSSLFLTDKQLLHFKILPMSLCIYLTPVFFPSIEDYNHILIEGVEACIHLCVVIVTILISCMDKYHSLVACVIQLTQARAIVRMSRYTIISLLLEVLLFCCCAIKLGYAYGHTHLSLHKVQRQMAWVDTWVAQALAHTEC